MVELFKEGDLADGSARHAFVLCFQADLLERDCFARQLIDGLVNDTVGAFANLFYLSIPTRSAGKGREELERTRHSVRWQTDVAAETNLAIRGVCLPSAAPGPPDTALLSAFMKRASLKKFSTRSLADGQTSK